ncbi:MAG: hypothetical protein E6K53_09470 [Gammaproteobacteria bacterium]|nr:MAG: hypothetical protein E6K53_09470 [Gammaproteobacteria bacterium]
MKLAGTRLLLLFVPLLAGAVTPEEDEARIEALLRAEKAGVAAAPATVTPIAPAATSPTAIAVGPSPALATPVENSMPAPAPVATPTAAAPGVPYASLKDHLGARVHVVLKNGAEHYAQLESADARQITLAVPSFEYTAQFSVPREQIARIDLR